MNLLKALFDPSQGHEVFFIPDPQYTEIQDWITENDRVAAQAQRATLSEREQQMFGLDKGRPYTGSIGGHIVYEFTPVGDSVLLVVSHSLTNKELAVEFKRTNPPENPPYEQCFSTKSVTDENLIKVARQLADGRSLQDKLSYRFAPTSVGMVLKLIYQPTGAVKDVSDYGSW